LQILWTDGARRNLDSIETYIALDNPRAAAKTVVQIVKKIQMQLADYPGSGKPGRFEGTRELIFPNLPYIAVYTIRGNTVIVISVFHAAQNLE
jgi:toxin ParE1/3/4